MRRWNLRPIALTIGLLTMMALVCGSAATVAAETKPLRSIQMAAEYPGVTVARGENVAMDLIFHNKGRTDENVILSLSEVPDGWKAKVKTYRFSLTGLHVPAEKDKTITFEAKPDEGTGPGDYRFRVSARTEDGQTEIQAFATLQFQLDAWSEPWLTLSRAGLSRARPAAYRGVWLCVRTCRLHANLMAWQHLDLQVFEALRLCVPDAPRPPIPLV